MAEGLLRPAERDGGAGPGVHVGGQFVEGIREHTDASKQAARARTQELFEDVGIRPSRTTDYPHELSGGQRQRVAIPKPLVL